MVVQKAQEVGISLRLGSQTFIKATDPNVQPNIHLSRLDHIVIGIPVTIFYGYHMPSRGDLSSILTTIKSSLAKTLDHFVPFAGQISVHPETGKAVVLCNNVGLRFVEASANVPLAKLDFYNQTHMNKQVLLPIDQKCPINVQFTSYTCGSFSISWTFNHALTDAYGFIKFLLSFCKIANGKKIAAVFNHDRQVIHPRSPPTYSKPIDKVYTIYTSNDILAAPLLSSTEQRLYLVKGPSLESLQAVSSKGGSRKTRIEALSAYLWKLMARTSNDDNARCKMAWAVDGRKRITEDTKEMSNFIGNVLAMAVQEERVQDLKEGTLSYVAGIVSQAIGEVANRDHFLDLIDWLDCHQQEKVLPTVFLDDGTPAIVVSSCHNIPVMSMDFGVGQPSVGMFCSTLDQLGAGYVNMISSGRDDGSWLVYAFIWPELAAALESDLEHVFGPFKLII